MTQSGFEAPENVVLGGMPARHVDDMATGPVHRWTEQDGDAWLRACKVVLASHDDLIQVDAGERYVEWCGACFGDHGPEARSTDDEDAPRGVSATTKRLQKLAEKRKNSEALNGHADRGHQCKDCGEFFPTATALGGHASSRHHRPEPDESECPHCGQVLATRQGLKAHITWKHKARPATEAAATEDPDAEPGQAQKRVRHEPTDTSGGGKDALIRLSLSPVAVALLRLESAYTDPAAAAAAILDDVLQSTANELVNKDLVTVDEEVSP